MVRCKYSTWLYVKDAERRAGWCNCELPSKASLVLVEWSPIRRLQIEEVVFTTIWASHHLSRVEHPPEIRVHNSYQGRVDARGESATIPHRWWGRRARTRIAVRQMRRRFDEGTIHIFGVSAASRLRTWGWCRLAVYPFNLWVFSRKAKRDAMMEITGIVEAIEASEEKARALLPLRYSPGYFLPFSPASFFFFSYLHTCKWKNLLPNYTPSHEDLVDLDRTPFGAKIVLSHTTTC